MPCQKVSINITIRKPRILMRFLFRGKEVRDTSFRVGSAVLWSLSRPSVPGAQIITQWKHILWEPGSTSDSPHKVYMWILLSTALFLHPPTAKGADRLNLLLFKNRRWPSIYLHQEKKIPKLLKWKALQDFACANVRWRFDNKKDISFVLLVADYCGRCSIN